MQSYHFLIFYLIFDFLKNSALWKICSFFFPTVWLWFLCCLILNFQVQILWVLLFNIFIELVLLYHGCFICSYLRHIYSFHFLKVIFGMLNIFFDFFKFSFVWISLFLSYKLSMTIGFIFLNEVQKMLIGSIVCVGTTFQQNVV